MCNFINISTDDSEEVTKCPLSGFQDLRSYRGRCYKYVAKQKTYSDAKKLCRDLSIDSIKFELVSIRDAEENRFITTLHKEWFGWEAWIGIRKGATSWKDYQLSGKWEDGLKLSNWANRGRNELNNVS